LAQGLRLADFSPPIAVLRGFSEEATRAFYLEFLGVEVEFEHRVDPDSPLYLTVWRSILVMRRPVRRFELIVPMCAALNAKNYRHASPGVQSQSWGYDKMSMSDPSGNRLVFGRPHAK
jgi:hypothetical protein